MLITYNPQSDKISDTITQTQTITNIKIENNSINILPDSIIEFKKVRHIHFVLNSDIKNINILNKLADLTYVSIFGYLPTSLNYLPFNLLKILFSTYYYNNMNPKLNYLPHKLCMLDLHLKSEILNNKLIDKLPSNLNNLYICRIKCNNIVNLPSSLLVLFISYIDYLNILQIPNLINHLYIRNINANICIFKNEIIQKLNYDEILNMAKNYIIRNKLKY